MERIIVLLLFYYCFLIFLSESRRSSRHMLRIHPTMLDVPEASDLHIYLLDLSANHITDLQKLALAEEKLLEQFAFLEKLDLSNNSLDEFPAHLAEVSSCFVLYFIETIQLRDACSLTIAGIPAFSCFFSINLLGPSILFQLMFRKNV